MAEWRLYKIAHLQFSDVRDQAASLAGMSCDNIGFGATLL
jgi:hypothetical protein